MQLSRLGGDEFALLIPDLSDEAQAMMIGRRMCETLRTPFQIGEVRVQIAGSAGVAIYPTMATDATDLFEFADYALYYAKRHRRSNAVLFSAAHKASILSDATIEQALQLADLPRELTVVYQPIVGADTRDLSGSKPWRGGPVQRSAALRPPNSFRWQSGPASSVESRRPF